MTRDSSLLTYEIKIGGRVYSINSSDAKEHIEGIEKKLETVFDLVGDQELSTSYSNATAKAALLLADEVIRKDIEEVEKQKKDQQRIIDMLDELDQVLK